MTLQEAIGRGYTFDPKNKPAPVVGNFVRLRSADRRLSELVLVTDKADLTAITEKTL